MTYLQCFAKKKKPRKTLKGMFFNVGKIENYKKEQ